MHYTTRFPMVSVYEVYIGSCRIASFGFLVDAACSIADPRMLGILQLMIEVLPHLPHTDIYIYIYIHIYIHYIARISVFLRI